MKLYCANCAFLIFLFRVQPGSRSTSVMKPLLWKSCLTYRSREGGGGQVTDSLQQNTTWVVVMMSGSNFFVDKSYNMMIHPGKSAWIVTFWAYSSQVGPTGTIMTWDGESQSGLEQNTWIIKRWAGKQGSFLLRSRLTTHHFPPKFSVRIAIILSTDPRIALWMITGLFLSSLSCLPNIGRGKMGNMTLNYTNFRGCFLKKCI